MSQKYSDVKPTYPESVKNGDTLEITGVSFGTTEYQGENREVATIQTTKGERSTFSEVLIKQLKEIQGYLSEKSPTICNVVQPTGKRYLTFE